MTLKPPLIGGFGIIEVMTRNPIDAGIYNATLIVSMANYPTITPVTASLTITIELDKTALWPTQPQPQEPANNNQTYELKEGVTIIKSTTTIMTTTTNTTTTTNSTTSCDPAVDRCEEVRNDTNSEIEIAQGDEIVTYDRVTVSYKPPENFTTNLVGSSGGIIGPNAGFFYDPSRTGNMRPSDLSNDAQYQTSLRVVGLDNKGDLSIEFSNPV